MPTSAAGNNRARGFTLAELMVVLLIVGLVAGAVVLVLPDPGKRVRDDAERFAARVRGVHDLAIIEGRSTSVWVSAEGYGFDVRENGAWAPMADRPFRVTRWENGVAPTIASPNGRDRVIFDSTGQASAPITVQLRKDAASARVAIGLDGGVRIDE